MPFDPASGRMKPNTSASKQARSKTAGPDGSFPIGDASHARAAVSGATRSERAGNISIATEDEIKRRARQALKEYSRKD